MSSLLKPRRSSHWSPASTSSAPAALVRGDGATGPGSGLGLAIVSEVLAAHGSALHVRPRDGGGSVLSFTLPRVER